MGSGQSQPAATRGDTAKSSPANNKGLDDTSSPVPPQQQSSSSSAAKEDPKEASLSGMPLVHYKCRKRKKVYDKCVSNFYTRQFLPGKSVDQTEACGELFDNYRTCMLKGIRKEIWEKQGLKPPKEGSPMDEVAPDDNDE